MGPTDVFKHGPGKIHVRDCWIIWFLFVNSIRFQWGMNLYCKPQIPYKSSDAKTPSESYNCEMDRMPQRFHITKWHDHDFASSSSDQIESTFQRGRQSVYDEDEVVESDRKQTPQKGLMQTSLPATKGVRAIWQKTIDKNVPSSLA